MEVVDDIELQTQVSKFQRVSSNTSTTTTDNNNNININNNINNNNNNKVVTNRPEFQNHVGWPSSRIVRVSRASGGKDRHSKVLTSKGLRDRRVRLSVSTAIQFYDLQDRLGCDQPSKAVEWLLKAAASSIDELPSLDPPFVGVSGDGAGAGAGAGGGTDGYGDNIVFVKAKSPACSSTSETSKGSGSGLSLSRSENRSKARERARVRVRVSNPVGNITPESSSFTDLLTGGINTTTNTAGITTSRMPMAMDYLFNNHQQNHQFSFLQDGFTPGAAGGGGNGGGSYNLNFAMTSSSTSGGAGGYRGTLQSNLQQSLNLPHHHHLQSVGSTPASLPFYIGPNVTVDHYTAAGGYHVNYGGDDLKEKSKN